MNTPADSGTAHFKLSLRKIWDYVKTKFKDILRGFFIWIKRLRHPVLFLGRLLRLLFISRYSKKRILGIWDYRYLPWSIGDPLVFIEMLSILKIKYAAEAVDICIVYDPNNPNGIRKVERYTEVSVQEYMLEFLPIFSTSPYLGSIFQFNSINEFLRFLKNNIQDYELFPPLSVYLAGKYNYRYDTDHLKDIEDFYKTYNYIPFLKVGDKALSWAKNFYKSNIPEDKVAIALTLRGALDGSPRNANKEAWLKFINECSKSFSEVFFVVLGSREEVFEELRKCKNVLLSKDFGFSIQEDLALIRSSLMYMGTESGINNIARLSDLPYLIFQCPSREPAHRYGLDKGKNFIFANAKQKTFSIEIPATTDFIFQEFKSLYPQLDKNAWRKSIE